MTAQDKTRILLLTDVASVKSTFKSFVNLFPGKIDLKIVSTMDECIKDLKHNFEILFCPFKSEEIDVQEIIQEIKKESIIVRVVIIHDKQQQKAVITLDEDAYSFTIENPLDLPKLSLMWQNLNINNGTTSQQINLRKAYQSILKRDHNSCISILKQSYKTDEELPPWGKYIKAMALLAKNDEKTAEPMLEAVINDVDFYAPAFKALSELSDKQNNRQKFLFYQQKEIENDPSNVEGRLLLCHELIRQDRIDEAIKMLTGTVDNHPRHDASIYLLSLALVARGSFEKASDVLSRFINVSSPVEWHELMVDIYLQQEELEEAEEALANLQEAGGEEGSYNLRLGEKALLEKKYAAAETSLNKSLISMPGNPRAKRDIHICRMYEGSDNAKQEATTFFKELWEVYENDDYAGYFTALSYKESEPKQFLATMKKVIALAPEKLLYRKEMAHHFYESGQLKKAVEFAEGTLEIDNKDYDMLLLLSLCQHKLGDRDMAFDLADRARKLVTDDWRTESLAPIFLMQAQPNKPLGTKMFGSLRKSQNKAGENYEIQYYIAMAYWLEKSYDKAQDAINRTLQLKPGWSRADEAKSAIEEQKPSAEEHVCVEIESSFWLTGDFM